MQKFAIVLWFGSQIMACSALLFGTIGAVIFAYTGAFVGKPVEATAFFGLQAGALLGIAIATVMMMHATPPTENQSHA